MLVKGATDVCESVVLASPQHIQSGVGDLRSNFKRFSADVFLKQLLRAQ